MRERGREVESGKGREGKEERERERGTEGEGDCTIRCISCWTSTYYRPKVNKTKI